MIINAVWRKITNPLSLFFGLRSRLEPLTVGKLAFSGCVHDGVPKNGVVHPRNYHHYPSGDDKWLPGKFGYVAAFDSSTQLWYNCPYTASRDNTDNYLCTDCWM
ncbi:hypothetical protein PGT21_001874 [Puccinia graminis f. sp. tritici]|uniref:Uncharacterized protein n=1 Tax=Puccinia graminis f. sp. tritici TaxID=56615 RepID=A0A5B0QT62_PUCGR|nr:hypothetical protein PGT21_001874 [Puccinia graminis f. sp. tritici]